MDLTINVDKYFVGEVLSPVVNRRFYVGKEVVRALDHVMMNWIMVMDELRTQQGIQYLMLPDMALFSESQTRFDLKNFIAYKSLDSSMDRDLIGQYTDRVNASRLENSGLVSPNEKVKNLKPIST